MLGFKSRIKPSLKARRRHVEKLRQTLTKHRHSEQALIVLALNRVVQGWTNYYAIRDSREVFEGLQHVLYGMLRGWAKSRHPRKSKGWIVNKYWRLKQGLGWLTPQMKILVAVERCGAIRRTANLSYGGRGFRRRVVVWKKLLLSVTNWLLYALTCWLYGSCIFWVPDCLWHALRGGKFSLIDFLFVNLVLPSLVALGIALVVIKSRDLPRVVFASAMMITGLLITAPFWLTVNATFNQGGALAKQVIWDLMNDSPWWMLPFSLALWVIDLSTYDGTLFSIFIAVLILIVAPLYAFWKPWKPQTIVGSGVMT